MGHCLGNKSHSLSSITWLLVCQSRRLFGHWVGERLFKSHCAWLRFDTKAFSLVQVQTYCYISTFGPPMEVEPFFTKKRLGKKGWGNTFSEKLHFLRWTSINHGQIETGSLLLLILLLVGGGESGVAMLRQSVCQRRRPVHISAQTKRLWRRAIDAQHWAK